MADMQHTLSDLIERLLQLNQNAIETFRSVNEAITGDAERVQLELYNYDGTRRNVTVPAFGFLKKEVNRLDQNFQRLSGLSENGFAEVELSDGERRRIVTDKFNKPPESIDRISIPGNFNTQTNWFFENFINPLLTVELDVGNQIPNNTLRARIEKYILKFTDTETADNFDETFLNRNNVGRNELLNYFDNENIQYIVDEDVVDLPPRERQYRGDFDILNQRDVRIDGVLRTRYQLNTINYNNVEEDVQETEQLIVGDELIANGEKPARYQITFLDESTFEVELELIEGYSNLQIGSNILSIWKLTNQPVNINVTVGFDERIVVFAKPIDSNTQIVSDDWSLGVSFYTNNLTAQTDQGVESLAEYYQREAVDFGLFLLNMAKDRKTPRILGIDPPSPTLNENNFKVTQINKHITDRPAKKELQRLASNRIELSQRLQTLDREIEQKRSSIIQKNYNSDIEEQRDNNELNQLVSERERVSEQFSSIVQDIETRFSEQSLEDAQPKYRIRGFFDIPNPGENEFTGQQEIVQFRVQYRYRNDRGANAIEQIEFQGEDDESTKQGAFSNWNEILTKARKKVKDENGNFTWEIENVENADSVNINQVDIPIQKGESVEFRISSLSEAGYPENPAESDFSESVIIDFDESIEESETLEEIKRRNDQEVTRVRVEEDLKGMGVSRHISDSFETNEKYFVHDATNISSGFLSPEQNPVTLFDKLVEVVRRVEQVEQQIADIQGQLRVKIVDEAGNSRIVNNNSTIDLFAGYYESQVADLEIRKGAIINKNWFISIENQRATPLELISRVAGDQTQKVPTSGGRFGDSQSAQDLDERIRNDYYYTNFGKYDYTPIMVVNPSNDLVNEDFVNLPPYQSAQLKGQWIYSRYADISGDNDLYTDVDFNGNILGGSNNPNPDLIDVEYQFDSTDDYGASGVNPNNSPNFSYDDNEFWIWTGYYDNNNDPVFVNLDLDNQNADVKGDYLNQTNNNRILLHANHPGIAANRVAADFNVENTKYANLTSGATNGQKQLAYRELGGRTFRNSFLPEDQYTLGVNSVGSYLFLAPNTEADLLVDGESRNSTKTIQTGAENAIQIPLTFQYRMTDFGGLGEDGIGFIGGNSEGSVTDLTYTKKIGIDLFNQQDEKFSFDVSVTARYRSNQLDIEQIPTQQISEAIQNIEQTFKTNVSDQ